MKKQIQTSIDERTYRCIEQKAERCDLSLPEMIEELLIIGVGAVSETAFQTYGAQKEVGA